MANSRRARWLNDDEETDAAKTAAAARVQSMTDAGRSQDIRGHWKSGPGAPQADVTTTSPVGMGGITSNQAWGAFFGGNSPQGVLRGADPTSPGIAAAATAQGWRSRISASSDIPTPTNSMTAAVGPRSFGSADDYLGAALGSSLAYHKTNNLPVPAGGTSFTSKYGSGSVRSNADYQADISGQLAAGGFDTSPEKPFVRPTPPTQANVDQQIREGGYSTDPIKPPIPTQANIAQQLKDGNYDTSDLDTPTIRSRVRWFASK